MTNFLNAASFAYQTVALQLMIGEANFYADKLKLSEPLPIRATHVTGAHIQPPWERFGVGSFSTANYFYSFPGTEAGLKQATNPLTGKVFTYPEKGKLAYLSKKDPFKAFGGNLFDPKLAKAPSLIDTNDAYQMATQWLYAISVNVDALEKKHQALVIQQWFYDPPISPERYGNIPQDAPKKHRPIFDVTWGGTADDTPPIWVQILGATRELIHIRMEDTSFSTRPAIVITNAIELNNRPDPPLKRIQLATNAVAKNFSDNSGSLKASASNSLKTNPPPAVDQK